MERLTEYDEFGNAKFAGIDNTKLYEKLVCDENVALTIATNKLGELEDVLEKYNIRSIDDLKLRLEDIEHYAYQENQQIVDILAKYGIENLDILDLYLQTIKNINIQNANLRTELAELKQKAIVPKYKIKQHIWLARNNVFQKEPCELIVQNIEYHFKTEDFLYIVDFVEKGHHKSINMCDNGDLFATKEEAEAKLQELQGEKK